MATLPPDTMQGCQATATLRPGTMWESQATETLRPGTMWESQAMTTFRPGTIWDCQDMATLLLWPRSVIYGATEISLRRPSGLWLSGQTPVRRLT